MAHFSCIDSSKTHKIYCFGGVHSINSSPLHKFDVFHYDTKTNDLVLKNEERYVIPFNTGYELKCDKNKLTQIINCFYEQDPKDLARRDVSILEYDPLDDVLAIKESILPVAKRLLGCAENSKTHKIYCFGGDDASDNYFDDIIQYDSVIDRLNIINIKLPTPRSSLSCTNNKDTIYCFGGISNNKFHDDIFKFDS